MLFCLTVIVNICYNNVLFGQHSLGFLPAVTSDSHKNSDISFILSTGDDSRAIGMKEEVPYLNSIQIVDAHQSWPPRWYTTCPLYTDEMFNADNKADVWNFSYLFDVKIEAGQFAFYKILSKQRKGVGQLIKPDLAGYILLNEKMEAIDTIKSNIAHRNLYYHDFRENRNKERIVDLRKDTYLDLRDYTDEQKDSAIHCNIDVIQILDSNNNVKFTWNPIYHINPELFEFKKVIREKGYAAGNSDLIEWTRLTSATWDYDGNILYSMKNIGIGKISRTSGEVMWQINHNQIPFVSGKEKLEWYNQHDFNYLYDTDSSAFYSLYSNGEENIATAKGIVFERNKKQELCD